MPAGKTDIQTSAQAAEALRPIAGAFAEFIFALGIVGTGLAGDSGAGGLGGLCRRRGAPMAGRARRASRNEAVAFYSVLALSAAIGIALNFTPINPISALYWSAVINGVLAVPVMVLLMMMARRHEVMGKFRHRRRVVLAGLAFDRARCAQRAGDGGGIFWLISCPGCGAAETQSLRNTIEAIQPVISAMKAVTSP